MYVLINIYWHWIYKAGINGKSLMEWIMDDNGIKTRHLNMSSIVSTQAICQKLAALKVQGSNAGANRVEWCCSWRQMATDFYDVQRYRIITNHIQGVFGPGWIASEGSRLLSWIEELSGNHAMQAAEHSRSNQSDLIEDECGTMWNKKKHSLLGAKSLKPKKHNLLTSVPRTIDHLLCIDGLIVHEGYGVNIWQDVLQVLLEHKERLVLQECLMLPNARLQMPSTTVKSHP